MNSYYLNIHWASGTATFDSLAEEEFEADSRDAAIDEAIRIMRGRPEEPLHLEGQLSRIHDDGDMELVGEVRPW